MTAQPNSDLPPVVLRYEGMFPDDLKGYEAHRTRKGGDLGHVDKRRSGMNRRLIGSATWAAEAIAEITAMKQENFVAELESLDRRKRRKDLDRRVFEGPHDPWRPTRHGPLREVILTANKTWFEGMDEEDDTGSEMNFKGREQRFQACAVEWLKTNFGDDVIHARADLDEEAYHIHAVILPRATATLNGATRRMLQPSVHPLIKDYEAAQDSVGLWFSEIGLRRGERRKQAFRDAVEAGEEPPEKRVHVRPVAWRRAEDCRLAMERKALEVKEARVAEREAEAEVIIEAAEGIADGTLEIEEADDQITLRVAPTAEAGAKTSILPRLRRSETGEKRAVNAFAVVWHKLKGCAEAVAEEKARRHLAQELAEIEAADEVIVRIAVLIPLPLRKQIAEARKTLTKTIMKAGKILSSQTEPRTPPQRRSDLDD